MAAPYRACIRIRSSEILLAMNLVQKRARFRGFRIDAKEVLELPKCVTKEIRVDLRLNRIQPCGRILATRAPRNTRLCPDFIMASKDRGRSQPLEFRKRLVDPALNTLRQTARLRDCFLRVLHMALFLVSSSEQEECFAVMASKLQ